MPITRAESNENEIVLNLRDTHQKSIHLGESKRTHTHAQGDCWVFLPYRMCMGRTTPYAGENKVAGLLEAWDGIRHTACIFNVAPAVASLTNHDT